MQLQQSFEEKSELPLGKHEKLSPRASSYAPKGIQSSQDYRDADIRLTHFGFVKDQDEFLSTRCRAFNYNKHSHMKMAYTFGTRRSTNMTSPQPRSIGLSTSVNNWANSSTAMKINDQSTVKGFGISVADVSDKGQITFPELTEDSVMSAAGPPMLNFRNKGKLNETQCNNSLNLRNASNALSGFATPQGN